MSLKSKLKYLGIISKIWKHFVFYIKYFWTDSICLLTSSSTIVGDNEFPNTNGFSWFPGFGGAMFVVTVTSLRIASYGSVVVPTPIKLAFLIKK